MIINKYRTFWRRFWAGWVDAIVFLPPYIAYIWIWKYHLTIPVFFLIIWHAAYSVAWYIYSIWLHGKYGQTIGKMLLKVKVMDVSEIKSLRYSQALRRDIVPLGITVALLPYELYKIAIGQFYMADPAIPPDKVSLAISFVMVGWCVLEMVTMLFSRRRRAIHDFIAGSVVIRMVPTKDSSVR